MDEGLAVTMSMFHSLLTRLLFCTASYALIVFLCVTPCCTMSHGMQAPINSIERQMLLQNVQMFYDCLGKCAE
jgi:hypothetical protein